MNKQALLLRFRSCVSLLLASFLSLSLSCFTRKRSVAASVKDDSARLLSFASSFSLFARSHLIRIRISNTVAVVWLSQSIFMPAAVVRADFVARDKSPEI